MTQIVILLILTAVVMLLMALNSRLKRRFYRANRTMQPDEFGLEHHNYSKSRSEGYKAPTSATLPADKV